MYDFPSSSFNEIFRSGTRVGGSLNSTQCRGYNSAERHAIITRTLPPVTCRRLHSSAKLKTMGLCSCTANKRYISQALCKPLSLSWRLGDLDFSLGVVVVLFRNSASEELRLGSTHIDVLEQNLR